MQDRTIGEWQRDDVHAYILAGGRSRRMGHDKAELVVGDQPLARRLAEHWLDHVAQVHLVTKPDSGLEHLGIPMVYDREPEHALVHGLRAVLEAPGPSWRLVLACDMPGVTGEVLEDLGRTAFESGASGSAPRLPERTDPEPLPSLWHTRVAGAVRNAWGLSARRWVHNAGLAIWEVPPSQVTRFVNVNTPEDWHLFRAQGSEEVAR